MQTVNMDSNDYGEIRIPDEEVRQDLAAHMSGLVADHPCGTYILS